RVLLDVYNLEWWSENQGREVVRRGNRTILATSSMSGRTLTVELEYDGGSQGDRFEWTLYSIEDLKIMGAECGLRPVIVCTQYNPAKPVTARDKALQMAFERV